MTDEPASLPPLADVDPEAYEELIHLLREGVCSPHDFVPSCEERNRLVRTAEQLVVRGRCGCGDPVCRTYDFPGSQLITTVIDFEVADGLAFVLLDERRETIVCFERLFLSREPMLPHRDEDP
jgi:hypothetical protein